MLKRTYNDVEVPTLRRNPLFFNTVTTTNSSSLWPSPGSLDRLLPSRGGNVTSKDTVSQASDTCTTIAAGQLGILWERFMEYSWCEGLAYHIYFIQSDVQLKVVIVLARGHSMTVVVAPSNIKRNCSAAIVVEQKRAVSEEVDSKDGEDVAKIRCYTTSLEISRE